VRLRHEPVLAEYRKRAAGQFEFINLLMNITKNIYVFYYLHDFYQ